MEDIFSVAYQQTDDEKDLEYAFFGIFDGHGGREATQFAKVKKYLKNSSEFVIGNINLQDNLMELITKNTKFWSDDDDTVLKAIREGFLETQKQMWKEAVQKAGSAIVEMAEHVEDHNNYPSHFQWAKKGFGDLRRPKINPCGDGETCRNCKLAL